MSGNAALNFSQIIFSVVDSSDELTSTKLCSNHIIPIPPSSAPAAAVPPHKKSYIQCRVKDSTLLVANAVHTAYSNDGWSFSPEHL